MIRFATRYATGKTLHGPQPAATSNALGCGFRAHDQAGLQSDGKQVPYSVGVFDTCPTCSLKLRLKPWTVTYEIYIRDETPIPVPLVQH